MHYILEYSKLYDFIEVVPVSALKRDGIDLLISILKEHLVELYELLILEEQSYPQGLRQTHRYEGSRDVILAPNDKGGIKDEFHSSDVQ